MGYSHPPTFMKLDRAKDIPGWMDDRELEFLARQAMKSDLAIEFGCYLGRSTRALGDNVKGSVIAIDPWDGKYFNNDGSEAKFLDTNVYDIFCNNLKDLIDAKKVIPIKDFSWAFNKDRVPNFLKADFIFIDGDHRYDAVVDDIKIALKYIKSGGVIAGHDYGRSDWPGVKQAADEMFKTVNLVETIFWVQIQ